MEPVTHLLTGVCIGRAGLRRKTSYAVLAGLLAAEAADVDILWGLAGPVEELKHHRGITHSLIAAPVVAGAVVGAVWLLHRWLEKRRLRRLAALSAADPGAPLPHRLEPRRVSWPWLYATSLIAALSHLLLDWTNNCGLRPFLPFSGRWYAGSFLFIAEPALWALLLLALVMPWLFGLVSGEIGARRNPNRGQGWAIFALVGMAALGAWKWAEHAQARALVENTPVASAPVTRVALEPYPLSPFRWHAILETADFYQTAEVDTLTGDVESDPQRNVQFKPPATAATEAAKRTPLGQVYLDWGAWAVVRDVGQEPAPGIDPPQLPANRAWTTVEFTDLRFAYSYLGKGSAAPPQALTGWVYIVDGRQEAGQALGGREQQ